MTDDEDDDRIVGVTSPLHRWLASSSTVTDSSINVSDVGRPQCANWRPSPAVDNNAITIEWDDWDCSLWTDDQRHLLERGILPHHAYIIFGVLLTLIVLFGVVANTTILYVFSRFSF